MTGYIDKYCDRTLEENTSHYFENSHVHIASNKDFKFYL